MGVDEFLVDPVAAALRKLIDAQLAGGEHHLAHGAVDFIAIDVDVGKVVVGADFLNLTQRVLQCAPIPQANVGERSLIVRRVGGLDRRLRGKFAPRDPVQSIGLPREVDVETNVGPFANQLVRLHDKVAHVPADGLQAEVTNQGGSNRSYQPACPWRRHHVDGRNTGAQNERHADDEQAGQSEVRIGVGHTAKDRVILEQGLEPADIHAHRERQQQKRKRNRKPAPGRGDGARSPARERPGAAGNENEGNGDHAGNHPERQKPAYDQLPGGEGE